MVIMYLLFKLAFQLKESPWPCFFFASKISFCITFLPESFGLSCSI
uniref:Uncharacterized protein n=1 Tax=Arundo donax TaxID=35708 RepID=A0A0A9FHZ3_ARUDO